MKRAVVVGAGLAGLAAAVRLARGRCHVTLVERLPVPGGRVRALRPHGREAIDFGQHLMLGCYRHTHEFARTLGTVHLLQQVRGETPFILGPHDIHPYRVLPLPSPLHALGGLFGLTHLAFLDRLALGRAGVAAKLDLRLYPGFLDQITAFDWLRKHGQSFESIAGFFEPLTIATLNLPPREASARLLATVLDQAFFAGPKDSVPVLPKTTLHDVFVGPSLKEVERLGGEVLLGEKVVSIEDHGQRVLTSRGRRLEADFTILAVPPWDLRNTAQGLFGLEQTVLNAEALGSSPIVTMVLWFERAFLDYPMACILHSPIQWLFVAGPRVSAVVSHATGLMEMGTKGLVSLCEAEVRRLFPKAPDLVSSLAIKAHKATFRGRPGQHGLRPGPKTSYKNLYLAGDWTGTGLPATIEGAVKSGLLAASAALEG